MTPEQREENWEVQLRDIARNLDYPPTPDIAGNVYEKLHPQRQPRTSQLMLRFGTIATVLACSLLLVPDIRAQVWEALRMGDDGVQTEQISPSPQAAVNVDTVLDVPSEIVAHTSILDFPGDVTTNIVQARSDFPYPIRLPTYPEDLGQPDVVYLLKTGHPYVIVGWLNENASDLALSLHMVNSDSYMTKQFFNEVKPDTITTTLVNDHEAYWLIKPHRVEIYANNSGLLSPYSWDVINHVLIWTVGPLTYRLETYVALDEAVLIAESLQ